MIPHTFKSNHITNIIRSDLGLKEDESVILSIKDAIIKTGNLLSPDKTLKELYDTYKDEDGFLYVTYSNLSTFGH